MTFLDAWPTHAHFARAAAATRSAPSARSDPSEPIFRKYIIVERDGRELALVFPSAIRHDQAIGVPGRLVSAGSYAVAHRRVILTGMGSNTLNLPSRPQDAAIIEQLFSES